MAAINRRVVLGTFGAVVLSRGPAMAQGGRMQSWPLGTPRKAGIHDLAPAPDGGVWFTAQLSGHLGWFDPASGRAELIALGSGSSPHGVIQGPDKAAWVTDGGQNAIVRVGWPDRKLQVFPLPRSSPYANLNTAAFDGAGDLWFTGQIRLRRQTGAEVRPAQREGSAARPRALRHLRHARPAKSGGVRWPDRSSPTSTGRPAIRSSSNRRRATRAHAACGATAAAGSG